MQQIDALDPFDELTELGHHLTDLPVEPRYGKMVLYSVVLKCLDPILTIACSLAYRDPCKLWRLEYIIYWYKIYFSISILYEFLRAAWSLISNFLFPDKISCINGIIFFLQLCYLPLHHKKEQLLWQKENSPPTHVVTICVYYEFSRYLHFLVFVNYQYF